MSSVIFETFQAVSPKPAAQPLSEVPAFAHLRSGFLTSVEECSQAYSLLLLLLLRCSRV